MRCLCMQVPLMQMQIDMSMQIPRIQMPNLHMPMSQSKCRMSTCWICEAVWPSAWLPQLASSRVGRGRRGRGGHCRALRPSSRQACRPRLSQDSWNVPTHWESSVVTQDAGSPDRDRSNGWAGSVDMGPTPLRIFVCMHMHVSSNTCTTILMI